MTEEFINVIADNLFANTSMKELSAKRIYEIAKDMAPFVLKGAKKELMKDTVETTVKGYLNGKGIYIETDIPLGVDINEGDKVKMIIIKED